jgi:hypothetical protein
MSFLCNLLTHVAYPAKAWSVRKDVGDIGWCGTMLPMYSPPMVRRLTAIPLQQSGSFNVKLENPDLDTLWLSFGSIKPAHVSTQVEHLRIVNLKRTNDR